MNKTQTTQTREGGFQAVVSTIVLTALLLLAGPGAAFTQEFMDTGESASTLSPDNPEVRRVMDVQNAVTDALMDIGGVVGVGTGMNDEGRPAILVFIEKEDLRSRLPADIEGIPLVTHVMAMPEALSLVPEEAAMAGPNGGGMAKTSTTRPVHIGTSGGNANDCSAGTIGVRVTDGTNVYALSCNHVFARVNTASTNELVLNPGRGDVACTLSIGDSLGRLADYETIVISATANNIMDAAIVKTEPWILLTNTPSNGYGYPGTNPIAASVNQAVQKYGKTTGLTSASILAINVTVSMNYGSGPARFINQIVAYSSGTFVDVGDSGSLVVTNNSQKRPVGIVFGKSGPYTYINPIGPILSRFNVSIDNNPIVPTPVELTSFSGRLRARDVELNWRTATELNNFGFQIQRSLNRNDWEDVGFVPGVGTTSTPQQYSFTDTRVIDRFGANTLHYRLLQIDRDGTQDYSSVVSIESRPMTVELQVYPHPVRSSATVQLTSDDATQGGDLSLYDATGRQIEGYQRDVPASSGMQVLPYDFSGLVPGHYFLEYRNATEVIRKRMLIVR